jgi:polysaccharide biosynthesis protein PslH
MITPYLPYPPVSGGRMRTYNLIKHLRDEYDITLVCFGRPEETAFEIEPLRQMCDVNIVERPSSPGTLQAALLSLTSLAPVTMRLYDTEAMKQTICRVLRICPPDVIHVESFYMLQNLPADPGAPVLLSEPAIEYLAWERHARVAQPRLTRPGIALEAAKMRRHEPRTWAQADVIGAMSPVDAEIIQAAVPDTRVMLTPNGVDVDYFDIDPDIPRDNRTAIFLGDYKYFPNTDAALYFAREILPLIQARRPDFQLTLLGKDPTPAMRALNRKRGITVTGLVDDIRPYLQSSAVFICPLRSGSGTRFKLMEALACGCPVVSTTVGCEGLGAVDGEHMLIRDDPGAFAEAVIDLLEDPALAKHIGEKGRAWVEENHAWAHSADLVREIYRELMQMDSVPQHDR